MKKNIYICLIFLITILFLAGCSSFHKIQRLKNVVVNDIQIIYDTGVLRIPGNSFKIGIGVNAKLRDSDKGQKDTLLYSKGFMDGSLFWSNFDIKTFGCSYSNGKIHMYNQDWPEKGYIGIDVAVKTQPHIHHYISIPKNYINQTRLIAQNQFRKAPGNNIKLGVMNTFDNSTIQILKRDYEVNKFLSKCNVYVAGGEYDDGYFKVTDNIFEIEFNEVGIIAEPVYEPSLVDTFSFQLDYIDDYKVNISAGWAFSGNAGVSGSSGSGGGCNGGNGSDGQDGSDGDNGSPGYDVSVDFDAFYDTILKTDLCFVTVDDLNNEKRKYYLVNPKGGSLTVTTYGGRGGDGGDGGEGGYGGNGGNGETRTFERKKSITVTDSTGSHTVEVVEYYTVTYPGGRGGNGGDGGDGGDGGNGGDGGDVYIYYTDTSYPYLDCLIARSFGGSGGSGGSAGSAGSGGSGGSGNPSGTSGSSGFSGSSGWSGHSGQDGKIIQNRKNSMEEN